LQLYRGGEDYRLPVVLDCLKARADGATSAAVGYAPDAGELVVEVERSVGGEVDVVDTYRLVRTGNCCYVDKT